MAGPGFCDLFELVVTDVQIFELRTLERWEVCELVV